MAPEGGEVMWEYVAAIYDPAWSMESISRALMDSRPGGVIEVPHAGAVQFLPRAKAAPDCQGCGAPLNAHIHHCEYCRRSI